MRRKIFSVRTILREHTSTKTRIQDPANTSTLNTIYNSVTMQDTDILSSWQYGTVRSPYHDNAVPWHFITMAIPNQDISEPWQFIAMSISIQNRDNYCHDSKKPWQIHCHENTELCDNYCHDNTRQFIAITIQKWDNSHNDSSEPGQHKAVTI